MSLLYCTSSSFSSIFFYFLFFFTHLVVSANFSFVLLVKLTNVFSISNGRCAHMYGFLLFFTAHTDILCRVFHFDSCWFEFFSFIFWRFKSFSVPFRNFCCVCKSKTFSYMKLFCFYVRKYSQIAKVPFVCGMSPHSVRTPRQKPPCLNLNALAVPGFRSLTH